MPYNNEPRRRARRTSTDLRQEILAAASDVFLRHGYAGTSVNAVIERVGGSKRAIYSHFGSKDDLLAAIVTSISEEVLAAIVPETPAAAAQDVRTSLVCFAQAVMRALMDPRTVAIYRLMIAEGMRMPALAESFVRCGPRRVNAGLARLLAEHAEAGALAIDDPAATAAHFMGLLRDDSYIEVLLGVRPPLSDEDSQARALNAVRLFLEGTIAMPSPPTGRAADGHA